jgi:hypothetical protein
MNILYTDEILIQFYYGECDVPETFEIEHVLESDVNHNHYYSSLYTQIQQMQKEKKLPKKSSLDKILAYSRL